jgi:hypothetical protein
VEVRLRTARAPEVVAAIVRALVVARSASSRRSNQTTRLTITTAVISAVSR